MEGMFSGEYVHPLDDKNRVVFPARLREALLAEKLLMGFYLTRGLDGCLLLFPKQQWDTLVEEASHIPLGDPEGRKFIRLLFNKAAHVTLDGQSRLLLPESHREMAGIRKEVVLAGSGKFVEIWPREKYEEYEKSIAGDYEKLAEKFFSKVPGAGGANGKAPEGGQG